MENEEISSQENEVSDAENFQEKFFWFIDFLKMFLAVIVFVQTFFYRTMSVEGDSMQNTFQSKDIVGISSCVWNRPKAEDIVIINTYDLLKKTIIKRVIAVEGQTIDIDHNGEVYVDGVKLNEPYIKNGWKTNRRELFKYPVTVPKGCFFCHG